MSEQVHSHPRASGRPYTPTRQTDLLLLKLALIPLIFAIMACGYTPPTPADTHLITLLGHRTIMQPGSTVEVPILVNQISSGQPVSNSPVKVSLGQNPETARQLFSGTTDIAGLVTAKFTVPKDLNDPRQFLIVTTDKLFGSGAFSRAVYVGATANLLISTDKPIYQPGQSLHARVLALDSLALKPAAGESVRLRLQNGDGTFLLDQTLPLSEWGIAHIDYDLDPHAPSGSYRLIASIGPSQAQRAVEVKPYTLPRFSVSINVGKPYFGVEDDITATVQAQYFFGKPVAHAKVHLEGTPANSDDPILHLDGVTDDTGTFAINAKVPIYFFDRVTHGTDTMRWVAVVTDTANHAEQTSGNVTIAADPLIVEAIPESGFLRPGLSNIVYLQVSLPDGSPVSAKLQINTDSAKQLIETDAAGLATFTMTSPLIGDVPVTVTAQARDIKHTQTIKLGSTGTHASVLLRPERIEYKAGEPIQVQYFVSGGAKTLYLDVAKDRQTLDFRALVLKDGAGSTTLNIDPALLGTLEVHAYALGPNGEVASDRRLVLINAPPAAMNLSLDAEQYAPGGKAKLKIDVARAGQSIPAALGVSIVDESVFAVGAQDPAFVRTYFLLQQELLQRRYGLSGFAPFEDSQPQQISAGIERSNQLALAGAMAQELAASPTAVPITAPTMTPVAQTQTDALIAGLGGRALFMLPLIGMLFYDHRRRRNRIMLATMIGLAVMGTVLMGCAPAAAPAASRVEAPAPEGAIAMGAAPIVEAAAPRLRQFFPETLMWLPDLNTDANGHAEIEVPLADSITTWRVSVVASGKDGTLGSASTGLRVFQDFFIEPTLPKQLTQNDEVEIPVSIYNYLKEPQTVEIAVQTADWFELAADKQTQQVALNPGDVTLIKLPIKVSKPGEHSINLTAKGSHMSDAIQKTLTVLPDGRKLIEKRAGTLARSVEESIELPKDVLSGTDRLSVGIAPAAIGAFPLNVPNEFWTSDCFYSDIGAIHPIATLAQYLKAKGQLIPEQQIRAEKLLQIGVQRLMRYYDPRSGGFSNDCHLIVRGKASASATAIALVALSDMQRVVYVDPAVIAGASNYLVNTQKPDGTWPLPEDDGYFYFCGAPAPAPDRAQTVTIAAALAESGLAKGQAAQRAMGYLRENGDKLTDAHSQALFANALLLADSNDALARRMLDMLLKQTSVSNGERLWTQSGYTYLDTTAIAALALLRSGRYTDEAQEALAGLRTHFGNEGYYIADPARVNMLRALLLDADLHPSRGSAEVAIQLNNTNVGNISITPENALVTQQKDWANELQPGTNSIQLRTRGDAVLRYQIQAEYYVPRGSAEAETLDMRMTYSTQQLKLNGSVNLVVSVINHAKTRSGPLIAEIRLPAGFVLLSENLPSLQTSGQNASFVFSGNGIVIGLSDLQPDQEMQFTFPLIALSPGRVHVPPSTIYPAVVSSDVTTITPDVTLLVTP